MTGRPTDCTPEVTAIVVAELKLGLGVTGACARAGIAKSTYQSWMTRGATGEEPFSTFSAAATRARADGVRALAATVRKAANDDWRAAAWMLERQDPDEWSKRTELTGKSGGPVEVKTTSDLTAMTDAELRALAGGGGGNADGG